jgi:hypothetical protein
MTESFWQEHQVEDKVRSILRDVQDGIAGHHFGKPFLSAYQLAIEFASRFPQATAALGMPVGGEGTGQRNSLAQYLSLELSRRIKRGELPDVEGAFFSNWHLSSIDFNNRGEKVHSSLTTSGFPLSMFRIRNETGSIIKGRI